MLLLEHLFFYFLAAKLTSLLNVLTPETLQYNQHHNQQHRHRDQRGLFFYVYMRIAGSSFLFTKKSPSIKSLPSHLFYCKCQETIKQFDERMNLDAAEKTQIEELHLPHGVPGLVNLSDICILHHTDYITGYSRVLKQPVWTAYTINKDQVTIVIHLLVFVYLYGIYIEEAPCYWDIIG